MRDAVNDSADSMKETMQALLRTMSAINEGNFSTEVSADVEGQFRLTLDQVAGALAALRAVLRDVGDVAHGLARGDLTSRVRANGRGDLLKLNNDINEAPEALALTTQEINQNTQQIASQAGETGQAVQHISDGASIQPTALSQVGTALRATSEAIADVASNTEAATRQSLDSVTRVRSGKKMIEEMMKVVEQIEQGDTQTDSMLQRISAAAEQQSAAVEEIDASMTSLGEVSRNNSNAAEELSMSAQELTRIAEGNSRAVGRFRF
jgi:methyl-accepting chemotaxis protein